MFVIEVATSRGRRQIGAHRGEALRSGRPLGHQSFRRLTLVHERSSLQSPSLPLASHLHHPGARREVVMTPHSARDQRAVTLTVHQVCA
jgi:hypothetical protein